jgi:hypothetical protein
MNKALIEYFFSVERLHKYFCMFPDDETMAIELYKANIKLSESLYSILSVTEIALRNRINLVLSKNFGIADWFHEIKKYPDFNELSLEIDSAIEKITRRQEQITTGKITAELTFGFWTSLFNARYEKVLWKSLRHCFPNLPKSERQRHKISAPLNKIRFLRNRVFHHEPIIWNMNKVESLIEDCYNILKFINNDLQNFLKEFDNSNEKILEIKELVKKEGKI